MESTNQITDNPVAGQIIDKWSQYHKPDSVVGELIKASIQFDMLSPNQADAVKKDATNLASHRVDDAYFFLKNQGSDYFPKNVIGEIVRGGLTDICLNAPDTKGKRDYSDDWKNALGQFKMQIGSLGLLSTEIKTSVATDTVRAICDATLNNEDASVGEGHRTTRDIEFLVTLLVDKGDTETLKQIEAEILKTADALDKTEEADSWKPGQAKWLKENIVPKIQDQMKVPEEVL